LTATGYVVAFPRVAASKSKQDEACGFKKVGRHIATALSASCASVTVEKFREGFQYEIQQEWNDGKHRPWWTSDRSGQGAIKT
jgi:hypothetical protein